MQNLKVNNEQNKIGTNDFYVNSVIIVFIAKTCNY